MILISVCHSRVYDIFIVSGCRTVTNKHYEFLDDTLHKFKLLSDQRWSKK